MSKISTKIVELEKLATNIIENTLCKETAGIFIAIQSPEIVSSTWTAYVTSSKDSDEEELITVYDDCAGMTLVGYGNTLSKALSSLEDVLQTCLKADRVKYRCDEIKEEIEQLQSELSYLKELEVP